MEKDKKILSPKIDIVFKMLFGEQKHERITRKLIEDIIEEKVEKLELEQTPYLLGMHMDDKVGIIDVRAKINDENPIDIEMQIIDNYDIEKRILFYWSRLYAKQIERGIDYERLNRTISIVFLDYEMEKIKELPIHTKWQIMNTENGKTVLTEDLELHIIEIPKIKRMLETGKLKKWILFLENPEGEETKKMAEKEEEIKEAIETLEEISSDEEKERIAELRMKYILDKKSETRTAKEKGLKEGREEGRKEGREEGRKEGREEGREEGRKEGKEEGKNERNIEIAKKLKKKGMSIEEIAEITELSKETISKL